LKPYKERRPDGHAKRGQYKVPAPFRYWNRNNSAGLTASAQLANIM